MAFSPEIAARELSVHERTFRAWEGGRSPDIECWPKVVGFLGFEPWSEPKTTAQKLKAARRRRGLSIERASEVLGVDPSTLWWWEHERKPRLRAHRARIAAFCGELPAASGTSNVTVLATAPPSRELIGEALRERRRELGLSQQQAAEAIGVNTWTVLLWEQGRYAPTPRFYPGLIRFLGREPWPEPLTVGERLRAERLRRGLTRDQLAAVLTVDQGSISKWESGAAPRYGASIAKVEAFLNGRPQPRRRAR